MPRTVLISIDWSEFAEKAFDYYVYNMHKKENVVILMHFIEAANEEEFKKKEAQMIELQEVYETRLLQLKMNYRWITRRGTKAGECIVRTAREENVSMIVMGARGQSKLKKAILGSVSDYVLNKSGMPVMICKWDKDK